MRLDIDIGDDPHRQEAGEPAVAQEDTPVYRERDDAPLDYRTVLEPPEIIAIDAREVNVGVACGHVELATPDRVGALADDGA